MAIPSDMPSSPDDRPPAFETEPPRAPSSDEDNLIGVTLQSTYELVRIVGEGGMGRVYEARHTRIAAKRYAVKVIRAEMAGSAEVRARFQREADTAASISHPNVVAVHDFGYAEDGRPYLVCEFLVGTGLTEAIRELGQLPVELGVHVARKVAQGLAAAHACGVIHRDLKPDNVHLIGSVERPEVKVLDFGLSKFIEAGGSSVTQTGVIMGTPSYMAPEQARGERADHRADIYGVGAILYSSLTGRAPFDEETQHATVLAVMSREPTRPRLIAPAIPEELELVIQRAMAAKPEERYQTMEEVDAALAHFDVFGGDERTTGGRAAQRQALSRPGSMVDDQDVFSARPQVVFLGLFALGLVLLGLVVTVSGVPDLLGQRPLSASEFWLILAVVIGTLLTPAVLLVRWFRRRYWNNSVKMVELVPRLRGPVLAAAATFGVVALLGRATEALAGRAPGGVALLDLSAWPGWGPILSAISVLAAATIALRRRYLEGANGRLRRLLAGPVLTLGALVLAFTLLQLGHRARAARALAVTKTHEGAVAEEPKAEGPAASPPAVDADPPARLPSPAVGSVQTQRAPAAEVTDAKARGIEALEALATKYPEDPDVLQPLVLALGRENAGLARAMTELDVLYRVAPDRIVNSNLSSLVVKAALSPGEASTRALDLMGQRMGSLGPDMLYDLMLTSIPLRQAARERLDDPRTRKLFSPALAVAFELRIAKSCEERLPLLGRVVEHGDQRAVSTMLSLATGAKRGCGPRKNKPCPPACPAEAPRFKAAATKLQTKIAAR